ncbi:MAG TPA: hypothetical protein VMU12_02690 [Candidatus Paceibacterota bacterium]|nr:hypothetical protein [Candidatus Paceibacterota bacterium]
MFTKTRITVVVGSSLFALALLAPTARADVSPSPSTTLGARAQAAQTQLIARMKAAADKEIARRIASLSGLSTRVDGMKRVSDSAKSATLSDVQSQITALTALKTKIDADTDIATLRTDVKSIVNAYRIYRLVIPQGQILVAADRITTTITAFNALMAKIQSRGTVDASASADFTAKLADAATQAKNAANSVAALKPDNGSTTQLQANQAVLKAARADLETARKDLVAARKDITTMLKGLEGSASPSPSPSVSPSPSPTIS